jgi:hypothetical protein
MSSLNTFKSQQGVRAAVDGGGGGTFPTAVAHVQMFNDDISVYSPPRLFPLF